MIRLRIPYKTFILGEYAILNGGLCLGAATEPFFEMKFFKKNNSDHYLSGDAPIFHPDSPAGKFLLKNFAIFKNVDFEFLDPLGIGGFGASTAQYLSLLIFRECIWKKRNLSELTQPSSLQKIVDEYRALAVQDGARVPSGADLVVQLVGGLSWIDTNNWQVQKLNWPWAQASGFFVSTGHKLATHLHLQHLSQFNTKELFQILEQSESAMKTNDFAHWLDSINNYASALSSMGLVTTETDLLLTQIGEWSGVLAAKGCGALGADVVFCVVQNEYQEEFVDLAERNELRIVATTENFSAGLQIHITDENLISEISHD